MNLSRRTFFKGLGMLAAMPFLARFMPEVSAETGDYLTDPDKWFIKDWDGHTYPRYKHVIYANSIEISSWTPAHVKRAKCLSDAIRRTDERHRAQVFNNAFTSRY